MTTTSPIPPTVNPYVARDSEPLWYGDSLLEFLIPSDATGGRMSVFRATMPEGFGPPRHIHTHEDESFVVLDGEVRFAIGDEQLVAGPGTNVFMPRGVPHTFRVVSSTAVVLGIITPGDFEGFFRSLGIPAAERTLPAAGVVPFDIDRVMAEQMRRGTQVVGPPLGA